MYFGSWYEVKTTRCQQSYRFGHEYSQTAALTRVGYVLHGMGGSCFAVCTRTLSLADSTECDDGGGGGDSGRCPHLLTLGHVMYPAQPLSQPNDPPSSNPITSASRKRYAENRSEPKLLVSVLLASELLLV